MPQMNPCPWLSLFLLFILSLYLINSMNYFLFNFSTESKKSLKTLKSNIIWKW